MTDQANRALLEQALEGNTMTTITAMQALEALDELESSARGDEPFNHLAAQVVRAFIGNALAAPATAPDQPAWHDAPTGPGLWLNSTSNRVSKLENNHDHWWGFNNGITRWYGPIPMDKEGGAK